MADAPLPLDPDVQLLADGPIYTADADLLARRPIAVRLAELACAQPVVAPRTVGLVGGAGSGRTSILHLAREVLADRPEVAVVELDAADYTDAAGLLAAMLDHLIEFFTAAGVVEKSSLIRDRLASYGNIVSGVVRLAGVKVDVAGALKRSPQSIRNEILEMTQEVGKRIVLEIDHVDRLAARELLATIEALRHYAAIPYVAIVLALDREEVARRLATIGEDRAVIDRVLQVELAVPPCDRLVLARVVAGGVARVAARTGHDIDPMLPLFDPDHDDGELGLGRLRTMRDAKRAANALAAALPLLDRGADLRTAVVALMQRQFP